VSEIFVHPLAAPCLLPVRHVAKPWGCAHLPEPFTAPAGETIGEIWFEPPAEQPDLLVKYIFTSENLSVQVHPSDAQTIAQGIGRQGKEECWLVVAAEEGAKLGIGFAQPMDAAAMRSAALDGSIEQALVWHDVRAGDFFYIPANTVHAIGAGVSVIEVQQNSDITYRLYDYGRPRALQLDEAVAVALGETYDLARWHRHVPDEGTVELVNGPYFRLHRVTGAPDAALLAVYGDGPLLVVPMDEGVYCDNQLLPLGSCVNAAGLDRISAVSGAHYLLIQNISG
jgi:mannose-6-phosphate isomerase